MDELVFFPAKNTEQIVIKLGMSIAGDPEENIGYFLSRHPHEIENYPGETTRRS